MRNLLISMCLILATIDIYGQAYQAEFLITASPKGCTGSLISNTVNVYYNGTEIQPTQSRYYVNTDNPLTGTIRVGANFTCNCAGLPCSFSGGGSTSVRTIPTIQLPTPNLYCHNSFFFEESTPFYDFSVSIQFYKRTLDAPSATLADECTDHRITLNTPLVPNYWQVANNPAGPWYNLGGASASTFVATKAVIVSSGLPNTTGANMYFRFAHLSCGRARYSNLATNGFVTAFVFQSPPPLSANIIYKDPSCHNQADGEISINAVSGDPSVNGFYITFNLNGNFAFGESIDVGGSIIKPVTHGEWQVTIRNFKNGDPKGLDACSKIFAPYTIINPPQLTITGLLTNNISCHSMDDGNHTDGSIQLSVSEGTSPFKYYINDGSGFSESPPDNSYSRTPTLSGLSLGNYQLKATYLSNGVTCESNVLNNVKVEEPNQLTLTPTKTDVLCKSKNTGAIDLLVSGGNGGYNYSWSATGGYAPYTIPNIEDPTNLFAGDYALTVTDSKGCSNAVPLNVSITEPASPVIVTATVPSRALHGGFDMTCALNDGIIELDIENEAFPINSYAWTKNGAPFSPSSFEYAENLSPGIYEVTILDNNNCDATTSVTLNPHPGITAITKATSDYNGFNTKCADTDEGEGLVETVTNAFGTISYTWFDGSYNQSISDLLPGNYAVTVSDGNGCSDDATLVITPPPPIQPNIQITSNHNGESISCPDALDGAMEAFPVNGFGAYTYLWDHGPATKAVTGLGQGTYAVTVTDNYGCATRNELLISDPATMQLNLTKTSYNGSDLSCHNDTDGEIQLTVANGIAPYTYTWSEGSSSQNISGLSAGDYTVTVTDQNNCVQTKNVTINNPPPLTLDLQHPIDRNGFDISCKGLADGNAKAFVEGGTAPYSYLWSGGQTTETILGQSAGAYTVQVNDANNCPNSGSITLVEPPSLQVTTKVDNPVSCFGGTDGQISLTGMGGAGSYSYSLGGVTYQPSNVFGGLNIGSKNMFIRDGNGCITPVVATMIQPDDINISFQNIEDAKCNDPVGAAQAVVIGGNGGYSYSWFDDATGEPMNTGETLVNAIASIYRVDVLDAKNCPASELVAISSIGGAIFDLENIVAVTCYGFADGSAEINVSSGISPYTFAWSDGQTLPVASALKAGNYFATVTDGLGCRTIKPLVISSPAPLTSVYSKTLPNCVGDCDGAITATANGGTMPYQYEWTSLSQTNSSVNGLCKGDYGIRITDAKNCLLEEMVNLPDPETLQILADITRPICLGRCDGSIDVSGQGGTGPYQFQWQDGPSGSSYSTICPGDYNVTMTDAHGCATTEKKTLLPGEPLPIDLGGEVTLCVGQSQTLNAGNNWTKVTWISSSGFTSSSPIITIKDPGSYFLEAIDAIGCIGLDTFKLETSLDLLQAEFIMPSEVIVGDTLVAIDISWPLPDKVEWSHPTSFRILPSGNPDFLFAIVPEPGTFNVGMQSFLAECRDFREKELLVLADKEENSNGRLGYKDALVQQFSIYPNPNDGRFDVNVLLSEEKEIQLRVINFPTGSVEARYDGRRMDLHQVPFDLRNLSQGLYFILLRVGEEQQSIRFVKK